MSNLPINLSDYNANEDFADMRPEDRIIPRMQLMQFGSQPVKDRQAAAGDFFDVQAKSVVIPGVKPGFVVPICYWMEWIEWNPNRKDTKLPRILARSLDPAGTLSRLSMQRVKVKDDKGKDVYKVSEQFCFLILAPSYTGNWMDLLALNFARSAHRVGKDWLNRLRMFRIQSGEEKIAAPIWAAQWELSSKVETGKTGDDYVLPVIGKAEVIPDDRVEMVKALAQKCRENKEALKQRSIDRAEETQEVEAQPAVDATTSEM